MDKGFKQRRKYPRFDVAHCEEVGGYITESSEDFRLVSLGLGGCGFLAKDPDPNLVPPRQIMLSLFENREDDEILDAQFVVGDLVYLRPVNFSSGTAFQYGIRFHEEDQLKVKPLISKLEVLADSGRIQMA